MAFEPTNTNDAGLGISGADEPADHSYQPDQHEHMNPETGSHFSSSSEEDEDGEQLNAGDRIGVASGNDEDVDPEFNGSTRGNDAELFFDETAQAYADDNTGNHVSGQSTFTNGPRSPPRAWTAEDVAQVQRERERGYAYERRLASPVFFFPGDDEDVYRRWSPKGRAYYRVRQKQYPERNERLPLPPSSLRKVKSVNDISPETSPKLLAPKPMAPKTKINWGDDEFENDGEIESYLRKARMDDTVSDGLNHLGEGSAYLPENDNTAIYDAPPANATDGGDASTDDPRDEVPEEAHTGDISLDTVLPPVQSNHECPPEMPTEEDEESTNLSTGPAGPPGGDAVAEDPTSPTPSSTSSIESTTGMTQSQGLEVADAYIDDTPHDLVKQRSNLKDQYAGEQYVDNIKEDPAARIELLVAKVHLYRDKRDRAKAEAEQTKQQYEERKLEHESLIEQYNRFVDQFDDVANENKRLNEELQRTLERADLTEAQEKEVTDLKERHKSLLEQLEQAEELEVAALKACEDAKRREEQWRVFAESNAKLAENERRRQETETRDIGTDTSELSASPATRALAEDELTTQGSDASTAKPPNEASGQLVGRPIYSDQDTQTRSPSAIIQPTAPHLAPLLRDDAIRWPARFRAETAAHIAHWINEAHARETRTPIERLTATQVEQFLGTGETRFDQLLSILEQAGYVFRSDRFAQDIEQYTRELGSTNLEAMHFYRRTNPSREHPARRLLEEIDTVRSQLTDSQAEYRRGVGGALGNMVNEMSAIKSQLELREHEIRRFRSDLADCHQHGEDLTKQKTELESTIHELTDRLCSSDSEPSSPGSTPKIDQSELDQLRIELAALKVEQALSQEAYKRHIDMLRTAKERIDELEAQAAQTMAENAELRSALPSTDAPASAPNPPLLNVPPMTPKAGPQVDARSTLVLPSPRSPDAGSHQFAPATPSFGPAEPAHWKEREATIANSEAYKRTREMLRKKREAEESEQNAMWDLRQEKYKRLCGREEVPYVSMEDRLKDLREQTA